MITFDNDDDNNNNNDGDNVLIVSSMNENKHTWDFLFRLYLYC